MVGMWFPSLLIILMMWAVFAIPLIALVSRLRLSRWWMTFLIVPFYGAIVLLWIVAFKRWPDRYGNVAETFA